MNATPIVKGPFVAASSREAISDDNLARPSAGSSPPPQLNLSWVDKMSIGAFVADDDPKELIAWTVESARSLVGDDREGARVRLLARCIAGTRAQMALLETALGERLAARDDAGVAVIDRVLKSTTTRLVQLVAEHRAHDRRQAVVVGIAHADRVVVKAGR